MDDTRSGIPARCQVAAWHPGDSAVARGLGHCNELGQVTALHGGVGIGTSRTKTNVGQAMVTTVDQHGEQSGQQESRMVDVAPGA